MGRSAAALIAIACGLVGAAAALAFPSASARCTTSPSRPANSFSPYGSAAGVGPGPVYAVVSLQRGIVRTGPSVRHDGLLAVKVLWIVRPSNHGPVSIRGRRTWFASDSVTSAGDPRPVRAIHRRAGKGWNAGWRDYPSTVLVRTPGCYDVRIDGDSFVERIRLSIQA